ncbi:MAG: class I SAM-dependent methyltransferase [Candidatus Woesebacteria bacterium]|jgi:ubiquinone/menaquinone biosynthesis C-methylase UbiE
MSTKNLKATINWYDEHADDYSTKVKSKINLDEIKQLLNYLPKNAKVLDAGCAAGRDSKVLKDLGCEVTGIDLSKELLKIAKKENPGIKFVKADFLDLPFKDKSFDGIWASSSLVHLEIKEQFKKALKEFKRVLKKEGILYFSVQSRVGEKKAGWVKDAHSKEGRFFQFFNMAVLRKIVEELNFEIVKFFIRKSSRQDIVWHVVYARKS